MSQNQQFQVNASHVVYEVFNDEILAINLDKGTYYSLRGSGSQIWSMMLAGATSATITKAFSGAHGADPTEVENEVERFLAQLVDHELIAPSTAPRPEVTGPALPASGGQAFQPPLVEIFTDMQDLLLLDPVHEADDAGWPVKKQETAAEA